MELRKFVEENGGQTEFARKMGVSQGLIWQWIEGKTRITAERAMQIEEVTEGKVARQDLRPDIFGPAADSTPQVGARVA